MVAANRGQLMTLIATNVFGRNTQAIAANEAQYGQMWAQDVAAMYGYAASSSSATQLSPFNPPQQNTNPAARPDSQPRSARPPARRRATRRARSSKLSPRCRTRCRARRRGTAPAAPDPLSTISDLISIFVDLPAGLATFAADIPLGSLGVVALPFDVVGALTGTHTDKIVSGWNGEQAWPGEGPAPVKPFPAPLLNLRPGTIPAPSSPPVLPRRITSGGLSVPPTWTTSTPAVSRPR